MTHVHGGELSTDRPVDIVEDATCMSVGIETALNADTFAKCNPQEQSPLFNRIPPEVRSHIFEYALAPYHEPESTYLPTDPLYRPEIPALQRFSTALLETCRLIWLEANHIPLPQAVFPFYRTQGHGPMQCRYCEPTPASLCYSLTPLGRSRWREVRCFTQLKFANLYATCLGSDELIGADDGPEIVRLMIRHIDWWRWDRDHPLLLQPFFVNELFVEPPGQRLKELRVELETLEWRVSELAPIIERVRAVELPPGRNGRKFELQDQGTIPDFKWTGPTNIFHGEWPIYDSRKQLDYRVVTILWKVVADRDAEPVTESRSTQESSDLAGLEFGSIDFVNTRARAMEARNEFRRHSKESKSLLFLVD